MEPKNSSVQHGRVMGEKITPLSNGFIDERARVDRDFGLGSARMRKAR